MAKTSNALKILKRRREKDPELQKFYEEEKTNLSAALAIRKAREEAGLTQEELAKKVETTQSVISRLEDADYEGHTLNMLHRIAEALHRRVIIKMSEIELAEYPCVIRLNSPAILKQAASFRGWDSEIDIKEKKQSA